MSEILTQTRAEDAVANTNSFLASERGNALDGDFASQQVTDRVRSAHKRAQDLLYSVPHPKHDGLYVPLSKYNANRYGEAVAALPGYLVLVPSALVKPGTSEFYPAVVSEDGLKTASLRLHVLAQAYHRQVGYGTSMVLSAAGQSETKGIGEHGRKSNDGVEAEHFATLLAAGSDRGVQAAWQAGDHINHKWRQQPTDSVTAEVSKRLFGASIPQSTITITKDQVEQGAAMLFWHTGMRDETTGRPETAGRQSALVVIQGLGYEALRNHNPQAVDTVKQLIA